MGAIRAGILTTMASVLALLAPASALAAGGSEPARGAPIGDVLWGTGVATGVTALVIWIAMAHRAGRITWLGRVAGFSERVSGLPGWAALPAGIIGGSLMIAAVRHATGTSPCTSTSAATPARSANPAHYLILLGLFGIFARRLPRDRARRPSKRVPTAIRITATGTRRSAAC